MRKAANFTFDVMLIDDSDFIPSGRAYEDCEGKKWRDECAAPNLQQLICTKGNRSIATNIRRGFEWAAELEMADYFMNIDSDMLIIDDFFDNVMHDLAVTEVACTTPIVSG